MIVEKQVILKELEEGNQKEDGLVEESQNGLEKSQNNEEVREFNVEELTGAQQLIELAESVKLSMVQK